jgi:hypothetical protein
MRYLRNWHGDGAPKAFGYAPTPEEAVRAGKDAAGPESEEESRGFAALYMHYLEDRIYGEQASSSPAFDILGLTPPFTIDDVKAAYRAKAKESHPDAGGDANAFNQVETAYRTALASLGRAAFSPRSSCTTA